MFEKLREYIKSALAGAIAIGAGLYAAIQEAMPFLQEMLEYLNASLR